MSNVDTEETIGTLEDNDIWEIAVNILIVVIIKVVTIIMVTNGMVDSEEDMDVKTESDITTVMIHFGHIELIYYIIQIQTINYNNL